MARIPEQLKELIEIKGTNVRVLNPPLTPELQEVYNGFMATLKQEYATTVWNPAYHLNHIDDMVLSKALQLVNAGLINSVQKVLSSNGDIMFTIFYQYNGSCRPGRYMNMNEIHRSDEETSLNASATNPIATCNDKTCGESRCVVRLAGYLKYLMDNNWFDQIMSEREQVRNRPDFQKRELEFDWVPDDGIGLKNIPEKDYQFAKMLADRGYVVLRPYLDNDKRFYVDYFALAGCGKPDEERDSTTQQIICEAQTTKFPIDSYKDGWIMYTGRNLQKRPTMCKKCEAVYCPYLLASYIKYCQQNGKLAQVEADRAFFRAHPELVAYGNSDFDIAPRDQVIEDMKHFISSVSDETIEIAFWLLDTNRVSLLSKRTEPDKDENRYFQVECTFPTNQIMEVESVQGFWELAEKIQDHSDRFYIGGLNNYDGIKPGVQIIRLVACIDYMRRMGIDFSDAISERSRILEEFMKKSTEIDGLDRILNLAQNPTSDALYCIVQGNRSSGKEQVIKQIASVLAKHGKISSAEYTKLTLQQVSEELTKHRYANGYLDRLTTGYEYHPFATKKLYVLTGLEKYLQDYGFYKSNFHDETRNSAYLHLAKMLGRFSKDTYVIITGEEKFVKEFLALDSKYRFLFGENVLTCRDLTKHEIYEHYKKNLSDTVLSQITDDKNFELMFSEYIAFNEKFLPFGNTELANYLANYSNVEGKPILPKSMYDARKTKDELENIVGMAAVKKQVKDFETFVAYRKRAEAAGINLGASNMHMQFVGNPGTGKTTIARIIAAMLFDIGVLKEDKLIEVERKDLVAQYLGQTATKTADKIKEAMGGVLFVDEAYSLVESDGDSFGKEAVATLIKAMEDHKNEFIVIFAGYEKEMQEFLKSNPGIESRIGYTFAFADYTTTELAEMFRRSITKQGFTYDPVVLTAVEEICNHYCKRKNFGNGRFIKKIEQQTIIKHSKNFENEGWSIKHLTLADIPDVSDFSVKVSAGNQNVLTMDQIVGLKTVKEQLQKFKSKIQFEQKAKSLGVNIPKGNTHMLFMGNPGTGKTTVARIIAQELYEAGVISENRLTETSPNDLIAKYVGQTGPKTQAVIDGAMGGVLFVDEAYQLAGGNGSSNNFGAEAVTTLIKAMEDHRDDFVCIFAGYEEDMKQFLDINAGISSRIGYTFHFEDYNAEELTQIFKGKVEKSGLNCDNADVLKKVQDVMQYFTSVPNFGNGRFAERVSTIVYEIHSENCADTEDVERIRTITVEDIPSIEVIIEHLPDGQDMIKPQEITDAQNERTAVHELGHALICKLCFPDNPIERITIQAEGNGALGYVRHSGYGIGNKTKSKLCDQICVCMAGIAAESVFLGEYGNGGTSDLEHATNVAWNMISRFGMSKNGFVVRKDKEDKDIEAEANELLGEQFERAKKIIAEHAEKVLEAKQFLLEKKTITDEDFSKILGV